MNTNMNSDDPNYADVYDTFLKSQLDESPLEKELRLYTQNNVSELLTNTEYLSVVNAKRRIRATKSVFRKTQARAKNKAARISRRK